MLRGSIPMHIKCVWFSNIQTPWLVVLQYPIALASGSPSGSGRQDQYGDCTLARVHHPSQWFSKRSSPNDLRHLLW
uniref:Uncharacterized protein n=1 Tax=Triticum urartu TaxID=4572 RepID=A0A8R7UVB6_TRIUA